MSVGQVPLTSIAGFGGSQVIVSTSCLKTRYWLYSQLSHPTASSEPETAHKKLCRQWKEHCTLYLLGTYHKFELGLQIFNSKAAT